MFFFRRYSEQCNIIIMIIIYTFLSSHTYKLMDVYGLQRLNPSAGENLEENPSDVGDTRG